MERVLAGWLAGERIQLARLELLALHYIVLLRNASPARVAIVAMVIKVRAASLSSHRADGATHMQVHRCILPYLVRLAPTIIRQTSSLP